MKICFFQIFKSSFSQPVLTMASSCSIPSNQDRFMISLKSTPSWFSSNPSHNIITILGFKQILFPHIMTTFVHRVIHNKVCIDLPCLRGIGWPGNPSPAETPVPKNRASIVSLQLFGLPTEAVVRNKQQLGWFLKPGSQVSSIFHLLCFPNKVASSEDGKKCWGILQIVSHPTLVMTSKVPAHQKLAFGVGEGSPKPHSMFPPAWGPKVIVAGTTKHTFWNYSNLRSA